MRKPAASHSLWQMTGVLQHSPWGLAAEAAARCVSVVIPNWNGADLLTKNLPAVCEAVRAHPASAELIVVDDGSQDDSCAVVNGLGTNLNAKFKSISTQLKCPGICDCTRKKKLVVLVGLFQ